MEALGLFKDGQSVSDTSKMLDVPNIDESQIKLISGHFMRVGATNDLVLQGASLCQIMIKGDWTKTDTVMRLVERVAQHFHAFRSVNQNE